MNLLLDVSIAEFNLMQKFRTLVARWLSDDGLAKKAYLNALAAMVDYGARLLVGFIVNPILLAGLGDFLFGVWQILLRAIGYISAASGRPTQALKWTLAAQQGSADYERKRRLVGSAVAVWLIFLPIMILIGGVLAWFVPNFLEIPNELAWSVRLATGILVVNLILLSLADMPRAVLRGENLGYKRLGLSAALIFVGAGFTILALYLDTGLIGVATAIVITTLLTGVLFLQVARKQVSWFGVARSSSQAVRDFLGLSGWFLVWGLIIKMMMASDIIILGVFDSVTTVTTYSLTKYVPETIISLVTIIVFGITPGLGGIIGAGDLERTARVRDEIMSLTWLITTAVGTVTILWNQTFVRLWVGIEYYAGSLSVVLIVIMAAQFVLIRNDANIIDLTLNLRQKVLLGGLSATLSIAFAGVLIGVFNLGIPGLCMGFIAGRSLLSLGYPWLAGRFLGLSFFVQTKSTIRPAFIAAIFWGLALRLNYRFVVDTWAALIFSVGITLAVVSLLAFYGGLVRVQRNRIIRRLRQMIVAV